jgi:SAM-dependent methyltransferase
MSRFWDEVARLPGLSPVIDYQAEETPWARYITALHLLALDGGLSARSTDRFLDYGCGVGRIASWLAPRVAEVIGVDTSAPMIEEARRRCRHDNVRYHAIQGPASGLPFRDLDGVTSIWVLQHILPQDAFLDVVGYLADALRPGASVHAIDRLCREPVDHGESDYLRLRSRAEYERAFIERGFSVARCHPICIDEQVLGRPALTRLVQRHGGLRFLARADLAWARRQRDPFVADYYWRFVR